MALAGGIPMPSPRHEDNPNLTLHKGATAFNPWNVWGGFKGATASPFKFAGGKGSQPAATPLVPTPPQTTLQTPPTAAAPAPPPTSADAINAAQEGYANGMKGFGYKASLLRSGKDPAVNTATGTGSLLGN